MKKLSFFLMAMLMSVMSFAATETISCTVGTVASGKITMDFKSLTFLQEQGSSTSAVKAYSPWRIYKNHKVTFTPQTDVTIENLVITCESTEYAKNGTLTNATATLSGTTLTITPTDGTKAFTFTATEAQVRWQKIVVTYKVAGEVVAVEAPKFDVTTPNFTEAFSLNITSAEGTTLKYTTDTTDPATSTTAVVINTNTATVAIPAKSTMVRAIAIKGEDVSDEKETTYCYVNSPATAYTVAEAMEVIDAGLGLTNELYVKGEISTIEKYDANYGSITYWIKDEEGNKFECYSGLGLNKAKFTKKEDLVVGSKVVVCGTMKKYKTTYEFNYNNYIVSLTLPSYTVTATAENGSVEGLAADGKYEHGAEATLTATPASGYKFVNWTSGETVVSTENPYKFTVTADVALVANFIKKTISYELNGGEFPTPAVPTQDSLIAAFKDGYNAYFGVSVATTRAIDNFLYAGAAVNDPTCDVSLFMKDDASPWKWLGDYVLAVTNAQIEAGLLVNLKELATELMWRQSLTAFFLQQAKLDSNYKGNADFTEAGKPEVWGAAYLAEYGVVLPTEPVDAPYTLPTPVKEGYKFVGWYDNAEGTGEPMTVIPAGWDGTLYAIWVEIYTITVETENGTVEGAGNYEHGAEATLTATAAEGYEFTCWTSGEDTVSTENPYKFTVTADVALVANFKEVEPEIEWMKMDLEITNLVTEVMEVGGAKFLQLMGRDDMNDADVTLFLNNYADVDDDYVVNAESSYMTFGGMELTVLEGTMTQTSETAKGTIYKGTVRTYAAEEERYVEFALTMYAAPVTVLVLTDAIVAVNEKLGTLTFNVPTGEDEGYYAELAGYTAPGVHQGPQICLFSTPEVVSYTNYAETSVADGIITLKGEFTSPMGPKFNLTISGKLPGSATALDNLNTTVAPVKAIINGQLIIINNGVQYNAQGQVIK